MEILSDSTKERDYRIKMEDYALHTVKEYWIVDNDSQTIEQYLSKNKKFELSQKLNSIWGNYRF